jgi:hypothetical protein
MQQPTCTICGDPTDATVCRRETASLAEYLRTVVDVAADVEVSVARLARYGDRGGRNMPPIEPEPDDDSDQRRRLPLMAHGWVSRLDKPVRGALIATALPYNPGMAKQAFAAINTITTWARHVCEERGIGVPAPAVMQGPLCRAGYGCKHRTCTLIRARSIEHPAARAAVFLLTQLDWIRHRPEADEMVEDLSAEAATLRRCVDAPPAVRYAGPCWADTAEGECEQELYAVEGAATVRCPACGTAHDVGLRRAWLLGQTHDVLLNAATMATALSSLDQTVTSSMIRNYADRGRIVAHGHDRDGRPTYRVGDVLAVLADTARRKAGVAA